MAPGSATVCRFVNAVKTGAESVDRQLNGQLATRSEDQREEDLVDASGISIRDMGSSKDLSISQ